MDKRLARIDPKMLALMHGAVKKNEALQPYAREVMLLECHVAGSTYRDLKDIEPTLKVGAALVLKREPSNPHDDLAIRVFDESGNALGYIPRVKNETLARLMDAGKLLFGRLESKEWRGDWLKAELRVYMRDF